MSSKKVILFIVEGFTDIITLESVICEITEREEIKFFAIEGDITSNIEINPQNIKKKINEKINSFLKVTTQASRLDAFLNFPLFLNCFF